MSPGILNSFLKILFAVVVKYIYIYTHVVLLFTVYCYCMVSYSLHVLRDSCTGELYQPNSKCFSRASATASSGHGNSCPGVRTPQTKHMLLYLNSNYKTIHELLNCIIGKHCYLCFFTAIGKQICRYAVIGR